MFTAQGDMRQALNNLQSTFNGFGHVSSENVFKVCDEPHPIMVEEMLQHCIKGDIANAYKVNCTIQGKTQKIRNIFRLCLIFGD